MLLSAHVKRFTFSCIRDVLGFLSNQTSISLEYKPVKFAVLFLFVFVEREVKYLCLKFMSLPARIFLCTSAALPASGHNVHIYRMLSYTIPYYIILCIYQLHNVHISRMLYQTILHHTIQYLLYNVHISSM